VSVSDRERLEALERDLKLTVFGQDEAITTLASAIKLARAGLREPEKPIGCYLFSGPTGVGKTEVAKQLSTALGVHMIRFDMSEYMEKHSVSKLIGSPPGYVGHEEGGQLTEKIKRNPYSVVLLDEIEKAHPDLFNILLQVFEDGHLTDGLGNTVDFKNTILIMTSNIGTRDIKKGGGFGFGAPTNKEEYGTMKTNIEEALKRVFNPEFLNRIDDTIVFHQLDKANIMDIVSIQMRDLTKRMASMGITVELTKAAR
jgi:ATP-dependent Clp protease ATP-binding subunit ClpC